MSLVAPALFASVAERVALERQAVTFIEDAADRITRARALVEANEVEAAERLDQGRNRLAELLGRYQRFKHGAIFNPVIQRGITSSAIVARGLKAECVLMGDCFGSYHARWSYADLASVWPAYKRDMLDMSARLLDHLRKEQEAIAKLLALSILYQRPEPTAMPRPVLAAVAAA